MRALPITLRLTLLSATASALVAVMLAVVLTRHVQMHFEEQDLEALNGKLAQMSKAVQHVGSLKDMARLDLLLRDTLPEHERMSVALFDVRGRLLFSSSAIDFPRVLVTSRQARTWASGGQIYRGVTTELKTKSSEDGAVVLGAAINISPHNQFLSEFERTVTWALVASLLPITLFSWLVARRGLAPLHDIARMAASISAQRLQDRLPLASVPAEITELARSFNDMLERLDGAFRRIREFSSDVAHELRTPIANVMMQSQVALTSERTAEEYRELLHSIVEEHERLARMVGDMLFIANAENGMLVPNDELVDLLGETRSLCAYYDALLEERVLRVEVRGCGTVRGDRLMLRRALNNLLSNAIRHSRHGAVIQVVAGIDGSGSLALSVSNPGEDVPPAQLARLFDRFYQVDSSRRKSGEGSGLGLAIVKSIVTAHGASVEAQSSDGQIRFLVTFPHHRTVAPTAAATPPSAVAPD